MITVDTNEFEKALGEWQNATKKNSSLAVDRGMKNTILAAYGDAKYNASSRTKVESDMNAMVPSKQGRGLTPRKILLVQSGRKWSGIKALSFKSKTVIKTADGKFTNKTLTVGARKQINQKIKEEAAKKVNARKMTVGYILLCIMKAGKEFGLFTRVRVSNKGWAAASDGLKSDPNHERPTASARISVPKGMESKINLQAAINAASADMLSYAKKRVAESAAKHSANQ